MLILIVKSYDEGSVLIGNSCIQCVSSAQMLKLTLQDHLLIKLVPRCLLRSQILKSRGRRADVDINHEFSIHSGVLYSGVLTFRGFYNQGFLQSGVLQLGVLTIRGSYNQGFLQSGVLTIRGSYNQGFLQSGVLTIRGLY